MRTPTSRGWRLARAGVFAVAASLLAALGHVLAGGGLPDPAVLITVTVFLGGSLSGFTGGRRTGLQIVAALLASQLAFHLTFSLAAHPTAGEPAGVGEPARMIALHVLAAVAVGWLMTAGESTLFRLFAALHRALLSTARRPPVGLAPHWTACVPAGVVGLRASSTELSAGSWRGPPRSSSRDG